MFLFFYKDTNLKVNEDKSTESTRTAVTGNMYITGRLRILLWQLEVAFTACQLANGKMGTVKNRYNEGIITNAKHMSVVRLRLNYKYTFI